MVTARCVIENPCCRHQNGGNCQFLMQVKLAGIVLFGWLKKKKIKDDNVGDKEKTLRDILDFWHGR